MSPPSVALGWQRPGRQRSQRSALPLALTADNSGEERLVPVSWSQSSSRAQPRKGVWQTLSCHLGHRTFRGPSPALFPPAGPCPLKVPQASKIIHPKN